MINWMCLPNAEGVLRAETEMQKAIFYLQQKESSETNGLEETK